MTHNVSTTSIVLRDVDGGVHTLALGTELLFDGEVFSCERLHPDRILMKTTTTTTILESSTLGQAYFGTPHGFDKIGELVAGYLDALSHTLHSLHCLTRVQDEIARSMQSLSYGHFAVVTPSLHFDAMTHRALQLFDGSDHMASTISSILDVPVEVIEIWATSLEPEKNSAQQALESSEQVDTEEQAIQMEQTQGVDNKQRRTRTKLWTEERLRQLEETFMSSTATNTEAIFREIAARFSWPLGSVRSYGHQLGLSHKKKLMSPPQLPQQEETGTDEVPLTQTSLAEARLFLSAEISTPPHESASQQAQKREEQPSQLQSTPQQPLPQALVQASQERAQEQQTAEQPQAVPTQTVVTSELFAWDNAKIARLTELFMHSENTGSVKDISEEIATLTGWPAERIASKIHSLHLSKIKQEAQGQHAKTQGTNEEGEQQAVLPHGALTWGVIIDDTTRTSWQLGYAYGDFPAHFQGKVVLYNKKRYQIQKIYNSLLHVASSAQPQTDVSAPKELSLVTAQ